MLTLARIETDFVVVEISGRADVPPALAARGQLPPQPRFEATSSAGPVTVVSQTALRFVPPVLFEERDYELTVRSKLTGEQPIITFRDPTVLGRMSELPEVGAVASSVRFRGQVGLASWTVRVGGQSLTILMEIFPAKLDYVEDYESLLDDVTRLKRALTLEYLRGTYTRGGRVDDEDGSGIEWLSLLHQDVSSLVEAVQYINAFPRRTLVRETSSTPSHRVRASSPSTLRAVSRGQGRGSFETVPGIGAVRTQIDVPRTYESLDTVEHRWLRSRLKYVHQRLLAFADEQRDRIRRGKARLGKTPPRLQAELGEIVELVTLVEQLLAQPAIAAATVDVPASVSTIQLQSAIGYEQAHRILIRLGSALSDDEETSQYSTSDLNELYEVWCFLKVAQVCANVLGADLDLSEMIPRDSSGLRFSLRKGHGKSVKLVGHRVVAGIAYNPRFDVPTGLQKPDIVLRVATADGLVDSLVVFDAKYRLDATAEYVAQFGAPGAPVDAVNELHRYRDAIEVKDRRGAETRPVVAGVALFPWPESLPADRYRMRAAADSVGVGALPLLPKNEDDLKSWLIELFDFIGIPTGKRVGHLVALN
jgi:hypothetical protein